MDVTYRQYDYDEVDYPAVVAIRRAVDPDRVETETELREYDEVARQAGRVSTRWLASAENEVVGVAHATVNPYQPDYRIFLQVAVVPQWQRKGIGRALLERGQETARAAGRSVITTVATERQPRALRVLEAAGYREADRRWESILDLRRWDARPFDSYVDALRELGVTVRSVAQLSRADDDWLPRLHSLYVTVEGDVPQPTLIEPIPLDQFEALAIASTAALPEAFLVAEIGGEFVGLTEPARVPDRPRTLAQRLTGVREDHRRQGIATGLKVLALTWAKQHGYEEVRTQNGVGNAPMLAINERLGFEPEAIDFLYMKELA